MTDQELKERNKQVVSDWIEWHQSELPRTEEVLTHLIPRLIAKYNIAQRTIYQIIEANSNTILAKKAQAQVRRILYLWRLQAKKDGSNKDLVDILEQERKEFEGNKIEIDGNFRITTMSEIVINDKRMELDIGTENPRDFSNTREAITFDN